MGTAQLAHSAGETGVGRTHPEQAGRREGGGPRNVSAQAGDGSSHFTTKIAPGAKKTRPAMRLTAISFGAEDEARTRYLHLGKVALYQMSYSRAVVTVTHYTRGRGPCQGGNQKNLQKENRAPGGPGLSQWESLQLHNIDSPQLFAVLGIGLGLEGHLLALFQSLEAVALDRGEVHKNVLAAHIVRDEAITLFCVEPFDCTVHVRHLQ